MSKYYTNKEIADILFNVAELLEVDEASRFRVNAYNNAALTVLNTSEPIWIKIERGDPLEELPTIGRDIADKIEEIVRTGELSMLEELEHTLPPQIVELSRVPGIGAKRIKILQEHYGALTPRVIVNAAKRGDLARLPGIGPKIENAIKCHFSTASHKPCKSIAKVSEQDKK